MLQYPRHLIRKAVVQSHPLKAGIAKRDQWGLTQPSASCESYRFQLQSSSLHYKPCTAPQGVALRKTREAYLRFSKAFPSDRPDCTNRARYAFAVRSPERDRT